MPLIGTEYVVERPCVKNTFAPITELLDVTPAIPPHNVAANLTESA